MTSDSNTSNVVEPGYRKELRTHHSPFRTFGKLSGSCTECQWHFKDLSQSAATRAAKRHVDANPDHYVVTRRIQEKSTYSREVSVWR